jgi:hypothetical protein
MRRTLVLIFAAAALGGSSGAIARDRPGTPNGVIAWVEGKSVTRLPRVAVSFRNTASEPVTFLMEWTENGVRMPSRQQGDDCVRGSAQHYLCYALSSLMKQREHPVAFIIDNLEFDSRYCFRFMARDEDGVISEIWSAWACAQTPPAPPRPPAPAKVQVTFLSAESRRGVEGAALPGRVLLEWDHPQGHEWVGSYLFQGTSPHRPGEMLYRGERDRKAFETTVDLRSDHDASLPLRFTVCSVNYSGSSCTTALSEKLLATAIPAAPVGAARAAAEQLTPKAAASNTPLAARAGSSPATAAMRATGPTTTTVTATRGRASSSQMSEPTRSQVSASAEATEAAQPLASRPEPSTPIIAQAQASSSSKLVARKQPVLVKPATRTMTTGGTSKIEPSQQAIPARAGALGNAPAGLDDIKTEEIRCKGGRLLRFENIGAKENAAAGSPATIMSLIFSPPRTGTPGRHPASGEDGTWLQAGTCAFANRQFIPGEDPQAVRFETAVASRERSAKRMQHGTSTAGDASPDSESIPKYLQNDGHFWRFFVYKTSYGHFQAVRHEAWKPVVPLPPDAHEWINPNVVGSGGGEPFVGRCSQGRYLAGVNVRVGNDIDSVGPICGRLMPDGSRGELYDEGRFGGNGGEPHVLVCPPTEPFVRGMVAMAEGERTKLVDGILLRCGPISGALAAPVNGFNTILIAGNRLPAGPHESAYQCPDAMTYAGIHGRSGTMVGSLGVICRQVAGLTTRTGQSASALQTTRTLSGDAQIQGTAQGAAAVQSRSIGMKTPPAAKGDLQIAGVAENAGSEQVIARLLNVEVLPDSKSVGLRFTARPDATPLVEIATVPPVADASGRLALPRPLTTFQAQRDNKNSSASVTRYIGASRPGALEQGTAYHYLLTVPGAASIPPYQHAGSFRTLAQKATVHFTRIHIIDDSDDEGAGELYFPAYISRGKAPLSQADLAGALGRFAVPSGENRRVSGEFAIENAPEILTIQVQGRDDDTPDAPTLGENPFTLLNGPTSSSFGDANLARQSFDLSKHWLRSESIPFTMRTGLVGGPASRLLFEVSGYIEVTRPEK